MQSSKILDFRSSRAGSEGCNKVLLVWPELYIKYIKPIVFLTRTNLTQCLAFKVLSLFYGEKSSMLSKKDHKFVRVNIITLPICRQVYWIRGLSLVPFHIKPIWPRLCCRGSSIFWFSVEQTSCAKLCRVQSIPRKEIWYRVFITYPVYCLMLVAIGKW